MTETLRTGPSNPGSLADYALSRGYDATDGRVRAEYSAALAQYRLELAEARGITLEELHRGPMREVGRISFLGSGQPTQEQNAA